MEDGARWSDNNRENPGQIFPEDERLERAAVNIKYPIILWWTGFTGERGRLKTCGERKCFFTVNRNFKDHPWLKVFMFYGTDFKIKDLPLPRKNHHQWALLHEESPKNNYILTQPDCLHLFNYTSTFKRHSDYPLTTQYLPSLEDLTSRKFFVQTPDKSKDGVALVLYVHSDCNPPSDRDSYVKELMKYIKVDALGKCLHNKDLPESLQDPLTMDKEEFKHIIAKYKFTLAIENALCDDYITEKFWRPLTLGSVPIYKGSSTIRDWFPTEKSAILIDDFKNPQNLAEYLLYLDKNVDEYNKYLEVKQTGKITNSMLVETMRKREWGVDDYNRMNFIDGFECMVCNSLHDDIEALKRKRYRKHVAQPNHLDCPKPELYRSYSIMSNMWARMYETTKGKARALRELVLMGKNFTRTDFYNKMFDDESS
ncbi:alpha-(1,3)-fucosyltransferase 10-like isoform X2 [Anneissia japonica]|nr:alpha-(1,3)-fucosyltransferase 10-like isoform X2 [Anneissia japonica]